MITLAVIRTYQNKQNRLGFRHGTNCKLSEEKHWHKLRASILVAYIKRLREIEPIKLIAVCSIFSPDILAF